MQNNTLLALTLSSALAAIIFITPAKADAAPITFGSYAGTTPNGLSNGSVTYSNNSGSGSVVTSSTYYPSTISGTSFVTYANGNQPVITSVYTTTYTGNLAGYIGSISLLADDTVTAYLNGIQIGTTGASPYDTLFNFLIVQNVYINGVNSFVFNVSNSGAGPTALDFEASAFLATTPTPEPNSFLLFGTGIVALVFAGCRQALLNRDNAISIS